MFGQYSRGSVNTQGGIYIPFLDLMVNQGGVDVGDHKGDYPHLGLSKQGLQHAAMQGRQQEDQQRQSALLQALQRVGGKPGMIDRYYMGTGQFDRVR